MGGVVKGIGKVVGAIPKGVGHAISGLPVVGGIGSDIEHIGDAFQGKGSFLGGLMKGGLPLAGLGLGGLGLAGQGPLSGMLGGLGSKVGGAISSNFAPGGQLDVGKLLGAGGQLAGLAGAQQQRKSAQDYANAGITQRNQLMSQILGGQNYGLPGISPKAPNLNQQSSATPAGGSGGSVGY